MPELNEIIGQDEAIERLQRAMAAARMPHAFIFAGPAGVGRRTTAIALAKTLLCRNAAGEAGESARQDQATATGGFRSACLRCEDCRMMAAGSHPDFHLVYKELARFHDDQKVRDRKMQELGIGVVRDFLIKPAGMSPSRGRGRIFVVLEAELMSDAAQNALLKTLEEPPEGVRIILICRKPEVLLPTTLSRCATIRFALLPRDFVTEKLIEAGVPEGEARFWAGLTAGSIGRAARLASEGMYEIKRDIIERLAKLAGASGDAELSEHLTKVAEKLAVKAIAATKKELDAELASKLASRRAAGTMLELIASAFSDAMTLATGAGRPIANSDQRQAVETLAGRFDAFELAGIIEALSRYEQLLWRNVNPKIVWDNVVITCASAAPMRV